MNQVSPCKKVFFLSFFLFLHVMQLASQTTKRTGKNAVYVEFATKGAFYSVNFDHIFHNGKKAMWSYRAGGFIGKDGIALPLGINLFTGKKEHHAEFTLVLTPYIDHYHYLFKKGNYSDKYLYIVSTAGYRYQKQGSLLFFKISAGPLLFLDPPSDYFWRMDPKLYLAGYSSIGINF
jgi:hypothetical protein